MYVCMSRKHIYLEFVFKKTIVLANRSACIGHHLEFTKTLNDANRLSFRF